MARKNRSNKVASVFKRFKVQKFRAKEQIVNEIENCVDDWQETMQSQSVDTSSTFPSEFGDYFNIKNLLRHAITTRAVNDLLKILKSSG